MKKEKVKSEKGKVTYGEHHKVSHGEHHKSDPNPNRVRTRTRNQHEAGSRGHKVTRSHEGTPRGHNMVPKNQEGTTRVHPAGSRSQDGGQRAGQHKGRTDKATAKRKSRSLPRVPQYEEFHQVELIGKIDRKTGR